MKKNQDPPTSVSRTAVAQIQALATELDQLGRTALAKAIEVGNLLRECKAGLGHGEWLPWIEENFSFSARTATRWMKVAEANETGLLKSDSVSDLSEAYRLVSTPRPPAPPFELPPLHQRLFLMMPGEHFACFEPMDEKYIHVTIYRDGTVEGFRKAISRDVALTSLSWIDPDSDWSQAVPAYTPWEPREGIHNHNLTDDPLEIFKGMRAGA